jgi:hypothetical protein
MDKVINFSSQNIAQPNWKLKYAALIALGSITDGPAKDKFLQILLGALTSLISLFQEQNSKVREALSWVFHKICEHHSEVFTDNGIATEIIPRIMEGLKDKPRISNQSCAAIEKLAEGQQPHTPEQEQNCLTPYYQTIIQYLLNNSQRTDYQGTGIDLQNASYTTLTHLIQFSCTQTNNIT